MILAILAILAILGYTIFHHMSVFFMNGVFAFDFWLT